MNINSPVNQLLIEKHMTQKELAKKIKVEPVHLSKVINGSRSSGPVRYKVSKYLKRPISELWPNNE